MPVIHKTEGGRRYGCPGLAGQVYFGEVDDFVAVTAQNGLRREKAEAFHPFGMRYSFAVMAALAEPIVGRVS